MAAAHPKRSAARSRKPASALRRRGAKGHAGARHGRELLAVACLAVAVFLVFVVYLGWNGGAAGHWLFGALRWVLGLLVYVAPLLLIYAAYVLAAVDRRRVSRPIAIGVTLLVIALLLAFAANSFGITGTPRAGHLFGAEGMRQHGGVLGELLWAGCKPLIGHIGVDVLVVALMVGAVLLISGSSLGLWMSRSRRGAGAAARAARRRAAAVADRRRHAADRDGLASDYGGPATSYGPAVSTHRTQLIDGRRTAPEIFAHSDARFQMPPDHAGDEGADDSEQLSLAQASAEAPGGEEAALAFGSATERHWTLPDPALLRRLGESYGEAPATIEEVSRRLTETLGHFGIEARVVDTVSGPRVTRYELQLAPGVKVNRVSALKDDIAYALAATDIRVLAPIPGKTAVGVEVPNVRPNFVGLGDVYGEFPAHASPLSFWLGKDITGKAVLADLAKMVHVLIAGTTGSGKSGCVNCIISSILLRATPDMVRMVMIDPKKVELSNFAGVPHLLAPVVTNMKQANYVLANICREMERRYEQMSRTGSAQNVRELNKRLERAGERPLPYIVLVIDELADLMLVSPAEVEDSIIRLGQLGRGAGIHLVVATQRPSVDVVTGMIKSNIPSRIAFAVSSQTDSRVILDTNGAESLLGEGDMLFHPLGSSRMLRVQGAFMTPGEMKLITEHWRAQAAPEFREDLLQTPEGFETGAVGQGGSDEDDLLADAIMTVVHTGAASVALLQRRLRVGYARAGRLVDIMERRGIISGYDGSKARNVLITEDELGETLASLRETTAPAQAAGEDSEPFVESP